MKCVRMIAGLPIELCHVCSHKCCQSPALATVYIQEFLQKRARGGGSGRKRGEGWFEKIDEAASEDCMDASKLGPYV